MVLFPSRLARSPGIPVASPRHLGALLAAAVVGGCASSGPRLNDNVKLEENLAKLVAATLGHTRLVNAPMPRFEAVVTVRAANGPDIPAKATSSRYVRSAGPYAVMKQTHTDDDPREPGWSAYYAFTPGGVAMLGNASALGFSLAGYSQPGTAFVPDAVGRRASFTTRQTIGGTPQVASYEMAVEQKLDKVPGFEWLDDTLYAIRVNTNFNGTPQSTLNLYSPKLAWMVQVSQPGKGLDEPPMARVVGAVVDGRQIGTSETRAAANPVALLAVARPAAAAATTAAADPLAAAPAPLRQAAAPGAAGAAGNCPTSIAYIEPQLPVCRDHARLLEMRQVALATDVSFRADLAQGHSLRQVAITASQAAQQYDDAMKQNEAAMLSMSADANMARARLAALRASPPRCDASDRSQGMSEASYQAYTTMYMATLLNRAVAAVAACRARSAP